MAADCRAVVIQGGRDGEAFMTRCHPLPVAEAAATMAGIGSPDRQSFASRSRFPARSLPGVHALRAGACRKPRGGFVGSLECFAGQPMTVAD